MPPAAISPKGRLNQGGARSSGAHLNHLSSGPLRKRCRVEKTKVSEKDAGYHAAELSLGELRLAGPQFERKKALALLPAAIPSGAASTASRS